jgi:hypothetical protein
MKKNNMETENRRQSTEKHFKVLADVLWRELKDTQLTPHQIGRIETYQFMMQQLALTLVEEANYMEGLSDSFQNLTLESTAYLLDVLRTK